MDYFDEKRKMEKKNVKKTFHFMSFVFSYNNNQTINVLELGICLHRYPSKEQKKIIMGTRQHLTFNNHYLPNGTMVGMKYKTVS